MTLFNRQLQSWYNINKRDLPWRGTLNPYYIWVSEIILQQTRVAQGLPFYLRYTERFPDVYSLASASEDEVLKIWEGLGYYSRARNMHKSAQVIVTRHNGTFPHIYSEIRALPGIGDYTAAAIGSIAFNLPVAAIDGNVARVIARYMGIVKAVDRPEGLKQVKEAAFLLLDKKEPGLHNQAMMELGALICTPQKPNCDRCPLSDSCVAKSNQSATFLPVKSKQITQRHRWFTFVIIETPDAMIIEKRTENDIWKGLYQFNLIETDALPSEEEILNHPNVTRWLTDSSADIVTLSGPILHLLTHQRITARFLHLRVTSLPDNIGTAIRANKSELFTFAFPVVIKSYLKKLKFL